ncbi:5'-nucleotidase [Yokenella regensburgei]|uniref:5'-nucleotidase n=1 Tax=Yokenella regensburgei TaxID=158877 RepID=UPI003EDA80ED
MHCQLATIKSILLKLKKGNIHLLTTKNSYITLFNSWDRHVYEFFLGGVENTKVLMALKPHIFFEDQYVHLIMATSSLCQ